ncbi:ferritin-like domain-containing protein [Myxococcus sp. RHSTA-1-4]|uniref:ferritin-like domain-containing protein n=1 Tax=Myxococcus sp. RHSTA-1-4 TaxID=2874601 RepID=UPI001CBAC52E|nr:ferritin-like domain-containing protein [Myxococcus sp. RHSTA-1-4]MBZ4418687.1 ferritin-like domain-containing protein [Myxococcus sp. RHSTA-1-4]
MLSKDQLDLLREIIFLDADAAASHAAALQRVEVPSLRVRLDAFRNEHLHHLQVLNACLERHGEAPVTPSLEVRHGPLVGRPPVGTKGPLRIEAALTAVTGCEHLVERSYALLLRDTWPPELEALLRHHLAQEREHALWLHEALGKRLWEPALAALT